MKLLNTLYWMNWKYDRMKEPKRLGIALFILVPWIIFSSYNLLFITPAILSGIIRWYWLTNKGPRIWRENEI